ncbi:hypothetical protein [Bosea sp. BH3]|uniref:hypothetical protein n=1 Tax=Bosea sp. BH3 TaxID=2871701 RepID=UPI0021CB1D83|nr:hypothetical protein [Bosea sp. BH3]MCU4180033.1 hypothetical protein [Bosea sp. BH3]
MIDRRLFLGALLGALALPPKGTAAEAGAAQPLPAQTAFALDGADAAFSQQRPQLHYNRQRQHKPPSRQRRRPRRRSHGSR